ncbi:hypothetical protein HBI79_182860 [Parastagonospora nodorum]|nr:hypothetical protein HBI79_182860 [Parastagonospora nodorum]KAH5308559.1 hypothetical protein HBI12_157130 [Parastagonospora nodorum]
MLRQYLSFLLVTAITAATVNAGCCNLPSNLGCVDTSQASCESVGGSSWRSSACTSQC